MAWGVGAALAAIVVLASLGTMLLFVGAYVTGGLCFVVGLGWFVVLYRASDP